MPFDAGSAGLIDLQTSLIDWKDPAGPWRLSNAVTGSLVLGGSGSGKSSALKRALLATTLTARGEGYPGAGGIFLCNKPGEFEEVAKIVEAAGRGDDLRHFRPGGEFRTDPLEFEHQQGESVGGGVVLNQLHLLCGIGNAINPAQGQGSRKDPYFDLGRDRLLLHTLLMTSLTGRTSVERMTDVLRSMPHSAGELKSREWQNGECGRLLRHLAEIAPTLDAEKQADVQQIFKYVTERFVTIPEKSRGTFEELAEQVFQSLLFQPLRSLFTRGSNLTPLDCFDGAIIGIDVPIQSAYGEAGRIAGILYKMLYQAAVLRRRGTPQTLRPVFILADEFQNYVSKEDVDFQALARSFNNVSIYLTQQYESLTGVLGEDATECFCGNLQTKWLCQQVSPRTNEWASRLLGDRYKPINNITLGGSAQHEPGGPSGQGSTNSGISRHEEKRPWLEPNYWHSLKRGGPTREVECVVFCGGKQFMHSGEEPLRPYKKLTFRQEKR